MAVRARDVEEIRRFNRFYTQKIGVLREGLLDSDFSLTEVRVLYELAQRASASASELCATLGLDPGYLSRILQRFERRHYLVRSVSRDDGRRHRLALTAAGRRAIRALDSSARREIAALTRPLGDAQRHDLLAAMRTIEATLDTRDRDQMPVTLRSHRPGDIGWVVQRHGELYFREYGWNEEFEALVAQIGAEFIRNLDPARERCWIAERGARRIGCVFVVKQNRTVAKLRLLLVEPDARGIGLGRRLIDECVRFARASGYRKLALWTQANLSAARGLYRAFGFERVAAEKHRSFGHDLVAETWELAL